jgi:hypothetical protein
MRVLTGLRCTQLVLRLPGWVTYGREQRQAAARKGWVKRKKGAGGE